MLLNEIKGNVIICSHESLERFLYFTLNESYSSLNQLNENFCLIFRDASGNVRYLIYFFNIIEASNLFLLYDKDKLTERNSTQLLNKVSEYDTKLNIKQDLAYLNLTSKIEQSNQQIIESEMKISLLESENKNLINDIISLLN